MERIFKLEKEDINTSMLGDNLMIETKDGSKIIFSIASAAEICNDFLSYDYVQIESVYNKEERKKTEKYFVILTLGNGEKTPMLKKDNQLTTFDSEEEANQAGNTHFCGATFGFEVFQLD